jgi:hypothetical protein
MMMAVPLSWKIDMAGEHDMNGTSGSDMSLALIEEQADASIRRVWHDGRMFFSVIDVIGLLTDAPTPRTYWAMMKERIQSEGFRELLTHCRQLKLPAADGKLRATDCADFATLAALLHALPALHHRATRQQPLASSPASGSAPDAGGCGAYAILNTRTNERSIGSSHDMSSRFAQHKALLRRGQHHAHRLQAVWNTYGEDAFVFVVLETLPDTAQLAVVEQAYLDTEQPAYTGRGTGRVSCLPGATPRNATHRDPLLRRALDRSGDVVQEAECILDQPDRPLEWDGGMQA